MPVGIIANVLGVLLGGIVGGAAGEKIPERVKGCVTLISSMSLLGIGITLIAKSASIGVVVLSLILGTVIGELVYLELTDKHRASLAARWTQKGRPRGPTGLQAGLCCAGGLL